MTLDLHDLAHFDKPAFPLSVAAAASLVELGAMRMWFQRRRIVLTRMDGAFAFGADPEAKGFPRLFTYRTVLTLAAAAALVRQGASVEAGYMAAKEWTWVGEGWNGEGPCPRDPACLFADPLWTFLIHYGGGEAKVVAIEPKAGRLDFAFSDLFGRGGPVPVAPTVVFLNKVRQWTLANCEGFLSG